MKTKRLLLAFLAVLMTVSLSLFAFACAKDKDPAPFEILSEKAPTIEVGQEYTLQYSANDNVTITVTVDKETGTYNAETKKFSATVADSYVLTVTASADGYADNTDTVAITVVNGPDKSSITAAIAATQTLVREDYTAQSWKELNEAKSDAQAIYEAYGKTEGEVAAAVSAIEYAVSNLVALPVSDVRATVSEDKITTSDGEVYYADQYLNFDDVKEEVSALAGDTSIKLISQYKTALRAILNELIRYPELTVTGAPNGIMLVNEKPEYVISVASNADEVVVTLKVNDGDAETLTAEDDGTYLYSPKAFGEEYEITVTAIMDEDAGLVTEYTYAGKIQKATYSSMDGVTVDDNVVSVNNIDIDWGNNKGKKAYITDLAFTGDVTVTFDVTFEGYRQDTATQRYDNNYILGIFFLKADGSENGNYAVINPVKNGGFIEVATLEDNDKKVQRPVNTALELNKTYHLKVTRTVVDGKSYLEMWLLDDNGRVVAYNDGNDIAKEDYTGAVTIGIQSENVKGKVSNIAVAVGTEIFDKSALSEALATYVPAYDKDDYTTASYNTYTSARAIAESILATATTEAQITYAVETLKTACEGLALKPIEYIVVANGEFEYEGETYSSALYDGFDAVAAKLEALKTDETVKTVSQYAAKVAEILTELEAKVYIKVTETVDEKEFKVTTGNHLVDEVPETITFTAEVSEDTEVEWTVTGADDEDYTVSDDKLTLTLTVNEGTVYSVIANAEKDGVSARPAEYKDFSYIDIDYDNRAEGSITIANDVIESTDGGLTWGTLMGEKVAIVGKAFTGDVTITFDVNFKEIPGATPVLGVFLLDKNGVKEDGRDDYAVVNPKDGFIEVNQGGDNGNRGFVGKALDLNHTYTVKLMRTLNANGEGIINAELYDGAKLLASSPQKTRGARNDAITLGIQIEGSIGTLSNFKVEKGNVVSIESFKAVEKALKDTEGDYKAIDYTGVAEYNTARKNAQDAYNNTKVTQAELDACAKALKDAHAALTKIAVTPAVVVDGVSFSYDNVTYTAGDYKNLVGEEEGVEYILPLVDELNDTVTDEMLVSEYDAAINALIKQLVLSLDVTVEGAPNGKNIIVNAIDYTIKATTENATISWTLNGEDVEEGVTENDDGTVSTFHFVANDYTETYTIVVTATREGKEPVVKTFESSFVQATIINNIDYEREDGVRHDGKIENNVISITNKDLDWPTNRGQKVIIDDLILNGEFEVSMDVELKANVGEQKLAGFFLLDYKRTDSGKYEIGETGEEGSYAIVNYNDPFVGIKLNNRDEPHTGFDKSASLEDGIGAYRLILSRKYAEDGKLYITVKLTTLDGKTIMLEHTDDREYTNNVVLGIQVEHIECTISNICLISGTTIAKETIESICDKENEVRYTIDAAINPDKAQLTLNFDDEDVIEAYREAREEIYSARWDYTSTTARIEAAIAAFDEAYAALLEHKIEVSTVAAQVEDDKFTYNGKDYREIEYSNYAEVLDEIEALDCEYVTEYMEAIAAILDKLEYALEIDITAVDAYENTVNNNDVFLKAEGIYTLTAVAAFVDDSSDDDTVASKFTFAWYLDDGEEAVGTNAAYTLTAVEGAHVATVKVTYEVDAETSITVSKSFTLAFKSFTLDKYEEVNVNTHKGTWNDTDKTYTLDERIEWDDWQGRNLEFDDLVFNGSFSAQMDITYDAQTGDDNDASVVTIHLLDADKLNRSSARQYSIVGYGCIGLHHNPVRLETGGDASIGKKESVNGGFENVADAMGTADEAGKFNVGETFTVKLDVYRTTDGKVSLDFSVLVDGQWITFARENDWGDDFGRGFNNGFIVGVNVEHAKVTLKNFKFELKEAGTRGGIDYKAGSVKSKASLYNVLDVNLDDYAYGAAKAAYVAALPAAQAAYNDNTAEADYVTAYNTLKPLYDAMQADRKPIDIAITVDGYNHFYNVSGAHELVAKIEEGVTDYFWTYTDAEGEKQTVQGATLTPDAEGTYENTMFNFTYEGKQYVYDYDISSAIVPLESSVLVGTDPNPNWGSVTVNGNNATTKAEMDWGRKDAIYIPDIRVTEFEMSFDFKYIDGHDGRVFAINLFGDNVVQPVVRFHNGEVGFDQQPDGGAYVNSGKDLTKGTYTFVIKMKKVEEGTYNIEFAVYEKDSADALVTRAWNGYTNNGDTDIKFTVENSAIAFTNFQLMYN